MFEDPTKTKELNSTHHLAWSVAIGAVTAHPASLVQKIVQMSWSLK